MPGDLNATSLLLSQADLFQWLANTIAFLKVVIGFSLIILVHELGHFWVAKWCGVRVDKFAIGFGPRLFGWRKGQGFTTGTDTHITSEEITARKWGESDYCLNALPFGGYVKMLGEDDILVNEETGEMKMSDDPRAFPNRPVGQRMLIVSAGVVFNVIFAALLYMLVFMIGHKQLAPIVGPLVPGSPAERAGLQTGDEIYELNGWQVNSFNEIMIAGVLHDEITVKVERDGEKLPEPFVIPTVFDEKTKLRMTGILPSYDLTCGQDFPDTSAGPGLKQGDVLVSANGKPVTMLDNVVERFSDQPIEFKVERTQADGETKLATAYYKPRILMAPLPRPDQPAKEHTDGWSYLGFLPRLKIGEILPGYPAHGTGLQSNDVVVQWGTIANPRYSEVVETNQTHGAAGKPVKVRVVRAGEPEPLEFAVTPTKPNAMLGEEDAKVGIVFVPESDHAIVVDIGPDAPKADLPLPRGSRLTSVASEPVVSWIDVLSQFQRHAGETVEITYTAGDVKGSVSFPVPSNIYHELGISRHTVFVSIAGETQYTDKDGAVSYLPSLDAVQALLIKHVGETVPVEYKMPGEKGTPQKAEYTVTENNVDPWPKRVVFGVDLQASRDFRMSMVRAGNPIQALWMGVTEAGGKVLMVYQTLRSLLAAEVSVRHVSGPVGVVSQGVKVARTSYTELLLFLATLSINLAVINFLPFPVVDGGVMVFLIIEKIKGSPISLKVQMATTIVGLSIILLGFLLITFKDIWSLFLH